LALRLDLNACSVDQLQQLADAIADGRRTLDGLATVDGTERQPTLSGPPLAPCMPVAPSTDARPHWCQLHHIHEWEAGGATDRCNLIPLCTRHHHDGHEGGWTVRLDPATRRLDIYRPDGR
jgi:hypothetical protein